MHARSRYVTLYHARFTNQASRHPISTMISMRPQVIPWHREASACWISRAQGFDPNPRPKKTKEVIAEPEEIEAEVTPVTSREVPTYVANRILTRIAVFSGVPVLIGICFLPVFYYLKVVRDIDVPTWIVYLSQFFTFGGGVFGISYAILSSSAGNQDDFFGFETFKSNLKDLVGK